MELLFINQTRQPLEKYQAIYTQLAKKTLTHLKINYQPLIEVNLVSLNKIRQVNKLYRHQDKITDVISFPFLDRAIKQSPFINLGLIIIAPKQAMRQANQFSHSFEREMSFLFVHGLLHLLGYDHHNQQQEQQMMALQDAIIGKR